MGEFRDISDMTLPELITEIELVRRKIVEHLQSNLEPIAEKLAEERSTEVKELQLSATTHESDLAHRYEVLLHDAFTDH